MKTNKIILIVLSLVVVGLLVLLFAQSQNKKNLSENQEQTKNGIETSLSTRDEVLSKSGFNNSSPRWGGGYVEAHPNVGIEAFFSDYWGKRIDKALVILTQSQVVYDKMTFNPISYCSDCGPLAIDFCVNPVDTNKSSIVGLYEISTKKPIKAWTVNPVTLKFQDYQDISHLQCNLDEGVTD